MNHLSKKLLLLSGFVLCSGVPANCQTDSVAKTQATLSVKAVPYPQSPANAGGSNWAPFLYMVQAGGVHSFCPLTNVPESNHVRIFFKRWGVDAPGSLKRMNILGVTNEAHRDILPWSTNMAVFGLTNGESREITFWNVRVQVPSEGKGTDGLGWDTIYDNYPSMTPDFNTSHFPPASSGEFYVERPRRTPWRVCILYSIKDTKSSGDVGKGNTYSGNYEGLGPEMK